MLWICKLECAWAFHQAQSPSSRGPTQKGGHWLCKVGDSSLTHWSRVSGVRGVWRANWSSIRVFETEAMVVFQGGHDFMCWRDMVRWEGDRTGRDSPDWGSSILSSVVTEWRLLRGGKWSMSILVCPGHTSSDEHPGLMSAMSTSPLTTLGHDVIRRWVHSPCCLRTFRYERKLTVCVPILLILNRCVFNIFVLFRINVCWMCTDGMTMLRGNIVSRITGTTW